MQDRQAGGLTMADLVTLAGVEIQACISTPATIVFYLAMGEVCCRGQLPTEVRSTKQHGVGVTIHAEAGAIKHLNPNLSILSYAWLYKSLSEE